MSVALSVALSVACANGYGFWRRVRVRCGFKPRISKHPVFSGFFPVASWTQCLQPEVLVSNAVLFHMIYFKVSEDLLAPITLPLLPHSDHLLLRRSQSASTPAAGKMVIKKGHFLWHPRSKQHSAARRFDEQLRSCTHELDARRRRIHAYSAEEVVVHVQRAAHVLYVDVHTPRDDAAR